MVWSLIDYPITSTYPLVLVATSEIDWRLFFSVNKTGVRQPGSLEVSK